jgi:hypothetical protein
LNVHARARDHRVPTAPRPLPILLAKSAPVGDAIGRICDFRGARWARAAAGRWHHLSTVVRAGARGS